MKVVLDTNIYLSGLIFPGSPPAHILNLARELQFSVYASQFIIWEIRRVLIRKFGYEDKLADNILDEILKFIKIVQPRQKINLITAKKDDNLILACAAAAQADFLVTGDKKHILPLKKIAQTKIVSAAEFMKKIGADVPAPPPPAE
jgi:putative PIN family toxin of toxin-antitoxin system